LLWLSTKAPHIPSGDREFVKLRMQTLQSEWEGMFTNAACTVIVVASPWIFLRNAVAAYLNKPTLHQQAYSVAVILFKEGLLEGLGRLLPFAGLIVGVARKLKEQEEKGYKDFRTYVDQRGAFMKLSKAVHEAVKEADDGKKVVEAYYESLADANMPFLANAENFIASVLEKHKAHQA
jgi:hypothetical protein